MTLNGAKAFAAIFAGLAALAASAATANGYGMAAAIGGGLMVCAGVLLATSGEAKP
jgi:hypothetical protein